MSHLVGGPGGPPGQHGHRRNFDEKDDGSEIFVVDYYKHENRNYSPTNQDGRYTDNQYGRYSPPPRPPSSSITMPTHHYNGSVFSNQSSVTKTSRKGGVVVETMSAPNPCCPNSKGVCCLLLLINLGLILLTLGFSIVLQIFYPPFVWYCGILFLLVGFIALISSLIFCVHLCRNNEHNDGQLYWTHHWQKRIEV